MRTARSLSWMSLVLLAALCCPPTARAEELQRELAAVKVGPAAIEWTPAADYETLVLTVSGPQGFLLRRELVGTIHPTFESVRNRASRFRTVSMSGSCGPLRFWTSKPARR